MVFCGGGVGTGGTLGTNEVGVMRPARFGGGVSKPVTCGIVWVEVGVIESVGVMVEVNLLVGVVEVVVVGVVVSEDVGVVAVVAYLI